MMNRIRRIKFFPGILQDELSRLFCYGQNRACMNDVMKDGRLCIEKSINLLLKITFSLNPMWEPVSTSFDQIRSFED
jgi:hypothetical protein